jgi:hypothetical protein
VSRLLRKEDWSAVGDPVPVEVVLPEGRYMATFTLERCRWLGGVVLRRGRIDIPGGIPIPSELNPSEDASLLSWTVSAPARNAADAVARACAFDVLRLRAERAAFDWTPPGGWPAHARRPGVPVVEPVILNPCPVCGARPCVGGDRDPLSPRR